MLDDLLLEPVPHDEAIAFIRDKPAVSSRVFRELLPELKARAFAVSGIEHFDTLQRVRDLVAEIPAGADWDTQKRQILAEVSPFLVTADDPEERAKQQYGAERRAELLLRLHGFQAYSAASYRTMDAQRDVFPFWRYQSMGDQKVRHSHAALDGKVLPADSEFWKNHYPPWEWGCRCQVVPLMEEDVDEIRAADAKKDPAKREVLEGAALAEVELNRRLVSGINEIADLRTAREKGDANGYEWSPGDLRLSVETLRARYDAQTWGDFEAWAKQTVIGAAGGKLWGWLNGEVAEAIEPEAVIRSFAELKTEFDQAIAAGGSPAEKRAKMHDLLQLPEADRSEIQFKNSQKELAVENGFDFVRRVVARSVLGGDPVRIKHRRHRAAADPYGKHIDGVAMNAPTVIHEMGHIVEARDRAALARSIAFREKRTVGEKAKWLGPGYKKNEIALFDEWEQRGGRKYSGKVYRHAGQEYATEILSMGLERLYQDPVDFYQQDPEYFEFVVNSTRGL